MEMETPSCTLCFSACWLGRIKLEMARTASRLLGYPGAWAWALGAGQHETRACACAVCAGVCVRVSRGRACVCVCVWDSCLAGRMMAAVISR